MRSIAETYINKIERSVQECVYNILKGQWLMKTYSQLVVDSINIPRK